MNLKQQADLAVQALQQGLWPEAIHHVQLALQASPQHPELLHILALALKGQGYLSQSQQAFEFCLQLQPSHAIARGNFANMLKQQGRFAEAERHYKQALEDQPSHHDARRNLAIMLGLNMQRYDEALDLLAHDETPAVILIQADIKHAKGETSDALALVESLLQRFGDTPEILLKRAQMLRDLGQSSNAFSDLKAKASLFIHDVDYLYLLACLSYDLKRWKECEDLLLKVIHLNPEKLEAHQTLNQLYWEQSRDTDFLVSYQRLRHLKAYTPAARLNEVATLIHTTQLEKASDLLIEGLSIDGNLAEYRHALGAIASRQGNLEEAEKQLQLAANAAPENARWQIDLSSIYIKQGLYVNALKCLNRVADQLPNNQEIWAYKGLCWRLLGDERFDWLYDHRLIDYRPLPIPKNYDNAEHFFSSLAESLSHLHLATRQPLDQSVAGGTQTMGNLFIQQDPVIQDYRNALQKRVARFLQSLPKGDASHPFFRRLTQDFRFAGAWSVNLHGDGFHTNHVHPEGWLSGPCYVAVPDICHKDDPLQQGWVILGETSLELGDREHVLKAICPEVGMSLLFPSYMWHGTRPFVSSQRRMTAPVDVLPV